MQDAVGLFRLKKVILKNLESITVPFRDPEISHNHDYIKFHFTFNAMKYPMSPPKVSYFI